MKKCPRCLFTSLYARTDGKQQCNYCDLHDELEASASRVNFAELRDTIKAKGEGKRYDCLIGISGGFDSSVLLWAAVKHWGLRPLTMHFDNGWNTPAAEHNMKTLLDILGVDHIRYRVNKKEYDDLCDAFLLASTPDADIPNDIAMTKLAYETAWQYGIKYILNGHDFRTEGSTPEAWTYMDAEYIRDVYRKYMVCELENFPLFTLWDQIFYGLAGIKQVRPFYYMTNRNDIEREMQQFLYLQEYGGKHKENVYTDFVGSYLLPKKFGIDKRVVHLSGQIRSGAITKQQAEEILAKPQEFHAPVRAEMFVMKRGLGDPKSDRSNFKHYNFKRYKPLIWLLAKAGVVPQTFYRKYAA